METEEIRRNIRKIREKMNLTQQKMSEMMKVSRTAYRNLETGNTAIFGRTFSRFLKASGKDFEDIIFQDSTPGNILNDRPDINEIRKQIVADYEERLSEKNEQISQRDRLIEEKNTTINSLTRSNDILLQLIGKLGVELPKND